MAIQLRPGESRGPSRDKDVAVEITNVKFDPAHVRGNSNPSVAAIITYHTADGDEWVQNYQAGSPEWFAVTPDGYSLTSAKPEERPDSKLSLSPRSEFSQLLASLFRAGVPEARIGTNLKNLLGLKGSIRAVVIDTYEKDGKTKDITCALFTKVDPESLKGDPQPATTAATASATAGVPAAAPSSDNLGYVKAALENFIAPDTTFTCGDGNKELKSKALQAFVKVKVPATARKLVMELITNPDVVSSVDGFTMEDGKITRVKLD